MGNTSGKQNTAEQETIIWLLVKWWEVGRKLGDTTDSLSDDVAKLAYEAPTSEIVGVLTQMAVDLKSWGKACGRKAKPGEPLEVHHVEPFPIKPRSTLGFRPQKPAKKKARRR